MKRWYVARTETNMERRAVTHAARFGIDTFLPEISQTAVIRGRDFERPALMFPCYIFVRFAELSQWARAKRDGYVFSYLLGYRDDAVTPIGDAVVDEIRSRMTNGVVGVEPPRSSFREGQRVRVARGSYADLVGTITQQPTDNRVSVLLSLFNRPITVALDDGLVVAA